MCNSLKAPPPKKNYPIVQWGKGIDQFPYCAFSACGNPNSSSGGGNSGSNNATILSGCYIGQLQDEGRYGGCSLTVNSDSTAFMSYEYGDVEGPITINGNNFTITGTRNGSTPMTLTGTVSADGKTLSNIKFGSSSKPGTLTLQ